MNEEMDPRSTEQRLTRAASEALEELLRARRAQLLDGLEAELPTGDISASELVRALDSETGVGDMARILRDLSRAEYESGRSWRLVSLLSLGLTLAGAIVVLAPVMDSLILQTPLNMDGSSLIAMVGGSISVLTAYFSALYALRQVGRARRRARDVEFQAAVLGPSRRFDSGVAETLTSETERPRLFLAGWDRIEVALRQLGEAVGSDEKGGFVALGGLLNQLTKINVLTSTEESAIRSLVRVRNELVHGEARMSVSAEDAAKVRAMAEKLENRLRHSSARSGQ